MTEPLTLGLTLATLGMGGTLLTLYLLSLLAELLKRLFPVEAAAGEPSDPTSPAKDTPPTLTVPRKRGGD